MIQWRKCYSDAKKMKVKITCAHCFIVSWPFEMKYGSIYMDLDNSEWEPVPKVMNSPYIPLAIIIFFFS